MKRTFDFLTALLTLTILAPLFALIAAFALLTVTSGLVVWIVLWALGSKGFDAFMLAAAIILIGASLKILSGYLPGRRS